MQGQETYLRIKGTTMNPFEELSTIYETAYKGLVEGKHKDIVLYISQGAWEKIRPTLETKGVFIPLNDRKLTFSGNMEKQWVMDVKVVCINSNKDKPACIYSIPSFKFQGYSGVSEYVVFMANTGHQFNSSKYRLGYHSSMVLIDSRMTGTKIRLEVVEV